MIDTFRFEVPASSANLGPGYQVLGVALDVTLKVRVDVRRKGEGIAIERRAGVVEQFDDSRHDPLIRAIHAAETRFSIKLPPALQVTIESDIPPACGLGTTSASYAAGLAVAARFAKELPSYDDLVGELVAIRRTAPRRWSVASPPPVSSRPVARCCATASSRTRCSRTGGS